MTPKALGDLTALSRALQEADAAVLQSICADEKKIRAQLDALDISHRSAQALPLQETISQRGLGVDMLWQVWVGRKRRDLQMQLARCLARKGTAKRKLQKSFGKRFALETVRDGLNGKANREGKVKAFQAITEMGVLQRQKP